MATGGGLISECGRVGEDGVTLYGEKPGKSIELFWERKCSATCRTVVV